jgi:hypothetical protein
LLPLLLFLLVSFSSFGGGGSRTPAYGFQLTSEFSKQRSTSTGTGVKYFVRPNFEQEHIHILTNTVLLQSFEEDVEESLFKHLQERCRFSPISYYFYSAVLFAGSPIFFHRLEKSSFEKGLRSAKQSGNIQQMADANSFEMPACQEFKKLWGEAIVH